MNDSDSDSISSDNNMNYFREESYYGRKTKNFQFLHKHIRIIMSFN